MTSLVKTELLLVLSIGNDLGFFPFPVVLDNGSINNPGN
jgi:hypothetical protein